MEGKHFLKVGISVSLGVLISISAFAGGTKWPKGWVRVGELGQRPKRISDEFPLSDQGNKGHWKEYEVMSDEFYGSELDSNKWHPTNPR